MQHRSLELMASRLTFRRGGSLARAATLRLVLLGACAAAIGTGLWLGEPDNWLRADPALAHLLRGMALIKSGVASAAIGAVFWRLRWPVSTTAATIYVVGSAFLAGSSMLVWQLSYIPLAALLFHAALIGLVLVGWRDR